MPISNYGECPIVTTEVKPKWVDYNGHMNDAPYVEVFTLAVNTMIAQDLGLDENAREELGYSIYTLENHICYLREALEGMTLSVYYQVLDCDEKRMHMFFEMEDQDGNLLATSEQMLMGMDMEQGRPAPFPKPETREGNDNNSVNVAENVNKLYAKDKDKELPKQAGRTIKITRKK
ncbi:thioesterase family protein [Natranaerobius thermophilus]|uniref:Thioesterase-like protein n=1 Tax=Natranaerobius thermophilus (strain ATCC BAA-1301 / DSM 18059 / JW/NM-WN-LF) TaxID=457570 RepID=B2A0Y0_NATTJ|nr:thioesterase family protein [Natranaerobius thermophilus]ACB84603.1 conserved hypothetical protein [Natranaerobius thermophilus JW/NM-WN-LF]